MKIEYHFMVAPHNMHMGGSMIIRIDHYPEPVDSLNAELSLPERKTGSIGCANQH